jgi:hypothetical protein
MATYNFTVRATDNLGAYADRNFSITVNNTNIERFVVVGTTGCAHSPDGVNWSLEAGQSGGGVTFGNGRWVIYQAGGMNLRTSTDAYNWTTTQPLPATSQITYNSTTYGATNNDINLVRYVNGLWYAFVSTNAAGPANTYVNAIVEYTSPDLVTWTQVRTVTEVNATTSRLMYPGDYAYDPVLGNYVLTMMQGGTNIVKLYSRSGSNGWTARLTLTSGAGMACGSLNYCNGMWVYGGQVSGTVHTSTDTIGWTARTVTATATQWPGNFAYSNGKLLMRTTTSSLNNRPSMFYSLNGGRTWAQQTVMPQMVGTAAGYYQTMATYGGKSVALWTDGSTNYQYSSDDFVTSTQGSVPAIGTVLAVAARSS